MFQKQNQIVQRSNSFAEFVLKLEMAAKKSLLEIELLPKKILSQAFELN